MKNSYQRLKLFKDKLNIRKTVSEKRMCIILNKINFGFFEQQIISPYIVDFYIPSRGLIIEVDGSIHNNNRQKEKDYKREDYLMSIGLMIQRFKNEDKEDYIIKILSQYPKQPNKIRKRLSISINEINMFFNINNPNIAKTNSIGELLLEYSKSKFKSKDKEFDKNKNIRSCCGLKNKFLT